MITAGSSKGIIVPVIVTLIAATLGAVFACEHTPELTPQQLRAMQTRTLQASYRDIFFAIRDVLQDDGYHIDRQDYKGGLISAQKGVEARKIRIFGLVFTEQDPEERGHTHKVAVSIERIGKNNSKVRLSIVHITTRHDGRHYAMDVVAASTYRSIFHDLQLEIKRRQSRS